MNNLGKKITLMFAAIIIVALKVNSQAGMPEELTSKTIKEQLNYLEGHTRIYENYRAIREDMFQKIKNNFTDTLATNKNIIEDLDKLSSGLKSTLDSINIILETTRRNLDEATTTKNSIKVLGAEINKITYNTVMWTMVAALVIMLIIGFLLFKRNHLITTRTEKELNELRVEFEAYRQSTRIAREKMTKDHFLEIQKLKGK